MISTAQFRNGLRIEMDKIPYIIVEFQHVKPGKGGAFVRTKLKNLLNGTILDKTFRSGEKVEEPDIEEKSAQYLYSDGSSYFFMDTKTFEQFSLSEEQLGSNRLYLIDSMELQVLYFRGNPAGVELPLFVTLRISETEPPLKGATASGGSKPAKTDTGLSVKVPPYIQKGELIKVDTRSGEFVERVKE